jgi:GT2 family glycosyltransferase
VGICTEEELYYRDFADYEQLTAYRQLILEGARPIPGTETKVELRPELRPLLKPKQLPPEPYRPNPATQPDHSQLGNLSERGACVLRRGEVLSFDTYFNSFSVGKWRRYTTLPSLSLSLTLKGTGTVALHHVRRIRTATTFTDLAIRAFDADEPRTLTLDFPLTEDAGLYYFTITAADDGVELHGGAYHTAAPCGAGATGDGTGGDGTGGREVNIAIGICTFRREAYLMANLASLRAEVLDNDASPLKGHLHVFVSDNGRTLGADVGGGAAGMGVGGPPPIEVFPNRNLGGSGGFTRTLLEIGKRREELGLTHVLLMDDDIIFDPRIVVRTYSFLRLLRDEYADAFLGGAMIPTLKRYSQTEIAAYHDFETHHSVKPKYDLRSLDDLIKNEIEDSINYSGWWYCCMPISVLHGDNLPLPLFIKRDDMEYSLRNSTRFITLNGIGVWHDAFELKHSAFLEYYWIRNLGIMNAIHRKKFKKKAMRNLLHFIIGRRVAQYRYRDAHITMIGVEDFLKGIDWLKGQDAEKLHKAIMALEYAKVPVGELDEVFIYDQYQGSMRYREGRLRRLLRKLTLNGWLLPARGTAIAPSVRPKTSLFFRARRCVNYEEVSDTAFVTEKSYREALGVLRRYLRLRRLICKHYDRVAEEYRERFRELTGEGFWEGYLFEERDVDLTNKHT